MTKVSHFMVESLPNEDELVVGGIYYLTNGSQYIVKSDKSTIKVTDILIIPMLPLTGIDGKLYVLINDDKYKLYTWVGDKYLELDAPNVMDSTYNPDSHDVQYVYSAYAVKELIANHAKITASDTNFGHVKVDGETIISNEGIISSVEEIVYDQSIRFNTPPSYFTAKKTITQFTTASGGAEKFLEHLELNYNLLNITYSVDFVMTIVTERLTKNGYAESIQQTIYLKHYSSMGDPWGEFMLQDVGKWVRVKNSTTGAFRDLAIYPINQFLKTLPNGGLNERFYGIVGATIYIGYGDTKYVCVTDLQSNFTSKWKKMANPTVLNVTDAPTPPSGEEFVYDAESVKNMVDDHAIIIASEDRLGHVKVDGKTIFVDNEGVISATPSLRYRSIESVGLEVGDLREYEITPDISMVIKRTIRNGHVSVSLKSTHGVELTGLDVQWRATTTYNLDDGVLGADEVKVIDTGVYVNNTEYPAFMIRYNDRMFRGDVMISGYLTTNKFFVFSEEL